MIVLVNYARAEKNIGKKYKRESGYVTGWLENVLGKCV